MSAAAGGLSTINMAITFRLQAGGLREVRFGAHELVRGMYAAVRDRNWGTVPAILSAPETTVTATGRWISFDAHYYQADVDFVAHYQLEVSDHHLRFSFTGRAARSFYRNRIGFCILHPMAAAGRPCTVTHIDGRQSHAPLPVDAVPDQPVLPFADMRAFEQEVAPGLRLKLTFAGDVFEMEDQRNWTDASFKTFCTPLHLPFPVLIEAGTEIAQAVVLEVLADGGADGQTDGQTDGDVLRESVGPSVRPCARPSVRLSVPPTAPTPLPALGTEMASHGQRLSDEDVERLRALSLDHLRVSLHLAEPSERRIEQALDESRRVGLPLEVALTVSDRPGPGLHALARQLRGADLARVIVYPAQARTTEHHPYLHLAREALSALGVPLFGGTDSDFFLLNRYPVPPELVDGLAFALNPQVHAFDDESLVETLEAQRFVAEQAHRLSAGKPTVVSPVTLKPRWNPYATMPASAPPGELPGPVDARQRTPFAAAWTLGCIRALSAAGVLTAITLYETTGWRGLMETAAGSPLPDRFPSTPGELFPLYRVLADIGAFRGQVVHALRPSHPGRVEALRLQTRAGDRARLLVANVTADPIEVSLPQGETLHLDAYGYRSLDEGR